MSNDYDSNGIIIPLSNNPGSGYTQITNPVDGTLLSLWLTYDQADRGFYCTRGSEYRLKQYKDPNGFFCTFHNNQAIAQQQYAVSQIIQNNIQYVSNVVVQNVSNLIGVDPTQLQTVLSQIGDIHNLLTTNDQTDMSQTAQIVLLQNDIANLKTIIKGLNIQNIGQRNFTMNLI